MAGHGGNSSDHHRHSRPPAWRGRRHVLLVCAGLLTCAIAAVLVLTVHGRSRTTAAGLPAVRTTTPPASRSTTSPPSGTTAPATGTAAVPPAFAEAMRQSGIPLDPHTGWLIAQGTCVRLGQPQYDQERLAEGVERLFPSVSDEQAHAFVALVAISVCHR